MRQEIPDLGRLSLEELGYRVAKPRDHSNPVFYQPLYQRDVDYWANGWFPNYDAQTPDDFDQHAKIVGYIERHAEQWIAEHRTQMDLWLEEARMAAD